jgi:hypothetical protein
VDQTRFGVMTRFLRRIPSRRDVLRGLALAGLDLQALWQQEPAAAKRKRKRKNKKKKAKPNAFGCLSVNKICKNAEQCCSGICDGKKGKRKCRAHDTGTCRQDVAGTCQTGTPFGPTCNNRADCHCFRSTAGSNVCAPGTSCADCQTDADCLALGFPPGAACAPISEGLCAGLCPTGMACTIPCGAEVPPPAEA